MKLERLLFLNHSVLPPSSEWTLGSLGWRFVRLRSGACYCLAKESARELMPGEVLVVTPGANGNLRASQLGEVRLDHFDFSTELLNGFLTLAERHYFETQALTARSPIQVLPASHKASGLFAELAEAEAGNTLQVRCQMLHLIGTVFGDEIRRELAALPATSTAARRFHTLISELSEKEIMAPPPEDLARRCGCSLRHFSRLFREYFGLSLREKQTEFRLQTARRLLASTDHKIIDVALESGYRHLGLFNATFKRHVGMTPSEWRQKQIRKERASRMGKIAAGLALLGLLLAAASARAGAAADKTNAAPATATNTNLPTFEVKGYEIIGNTLFRYEDLEPIFTNYLGSKVTFQTIRKALADLQMAYRDRGFATVNVSLPQQQLTNGLVKVKVTEGRLSDIAIVNNKHYSSNNIMRALPGLRTNMLLNALVFQQDLDRANGNRDRQIYPKIAPGPDPGTSSLILTVKDRFPLHSRVDFNNYSTPGTPDLRLNLSAEYRNLWQLEHQVGAQYSFTPADTKEADQGAAFYDQPLIANYSAFYRLPLVVVENETRQRDLRVGDFGYDEVTHRFRPPPAENFLDLLFYASRSFSDTGNQLQSENFNPPGKVTSGLQITDRLFSETLTKNENLGVRLSSPLPGFWNVRSSISGGLDYKSYRSHGERVRSFFASYFVPIPGTSESEEFQSPPVINPPDISETRVEYLPFALNWEGARQDPWGTTAVNINNTFHWNGFFNNAADFRAVAGSSKASGNYYIGNFGLTREQKIYGEYGVRLHADGQWANEPLINNEQFGLGGNAGTRGYRDGQEYGDTGWRVQIEPHTPLYNLGLVNKQAPLYFRFFGFTDYGQRYLLDPGSRAGSLALWGAGFGFNASIGEHFDLRFTYGVSLLDIPGVSAGSGRLTFSLGGQF